ncbi:hypothetical protein JN00_0344 [Metamycoplasma subdolum]|uniref:Lipoprotein n=1 Tax=Metamycoplasma subdolum TaxID=92407 RepID=A0A3M0A248_9BACT|nr:hypothetical protein [Metamycoplasma subdolum]RMA78514.1 hypothetical protein JN00_0344 [Metamycoplasma subdolum]WPB50446.1 hypothetical protein R9C05_02465 [Metamycoplasma subdolum]
MKKSKFLLLTLSPLFSFPAVVLSASCEREEEPKVEEEQTNLNYELTIDLMNDFQKRYIQEFQQKEKKFGLKDDQLDALFRGSSYTFTTVENTKINHNEESIFVNLTKISNGLFIRLVNQSKSILDSMYKLIKDLELEAEVKTNIFRKFYLILTGTIDSFVKKIIELAAKKHQAETTHKPFNLQKEFMESVSKMMWDFSNNSTLMLGTFDDMAVVMKKLTMQLKNDEELKNIPNIEQKLEEISKVFSLVSEEELSSALKTRVTEEIAKIRKKFGSISNTSIVFLVNNFNHLFQQMKNEEFEVVRTQFSDKATQDKVIEKLQKNKFDKLESFLADAINTMKMISFEYKNGFNILFGDVPYSEPQAKASLQKVKANLLENLEKILEHLEIKDPLKTKVKDVILTEAKIESAIQKIYKFMEATTKMLDDLKISNFLKNTIQQLNAKVLPFVLDYLLYGIIDAAKFKNDNPAAKKEDFFNLKKAELKGLMKFVDLFIMHVNPDIQKLLKEMVFKTLSGSLELNKDEYIVKMDVLLKSEAYEKILQTLFGLLIPQQPKIEALPTKNKLEQLNDILQIYDETKMLWGLVRNGTIDKLELPALAKAKFKSEYAKKTTITEKAFDLKIDIVGKEFENNILGSLFNFVNILNSLQEELFS